MKKKKLYLPLLAIVIMITVVLLTNVQSLLANYNIVDDIQLSTSSNTLSEGETVTLTLTDTNREDTKVVIPIDESLEFIESDYLDGAVVYDSLNKQLVVDWIDAAKEQKNVSITLRTTKQGTYEVKALTVREDKEVSTNITELEVENVDESNVEDSSELPTDEIVSEDSSSMGETESRNEQDAVPENENAGKEEGIAEEAKEGRADLTGVWGTAPWSFDKATGVLEIGSGTITPAFMRVSPWNNNTEFFRNYPIKVISFKGKVILPSDSKELFANNNSSTNFLPEVERFDGMENLDTSQVTSMSSMFSGLEKLISLDVSNFDTSNVTNMNSMFQVLRLVPSLDVSNFDTSNVTNMSQMFFGVNAVRSLDVSNFDTSNVTDMEYMYSGMSLQKLILGDKITIDTTNLDKPKSLQFGDRTTGKWILEGSYNTGYTPEEFMKNYGQIPELQAGTYVAEVVKPASISGESKLTGENTANPLAAKVYVNEKVKFENNIHHEGSVFNYTYKTTIPEAVTLDLDSFTGYMINENGEKIELSKDAFTFDKSSRVLEVNPKGVSKTDSRGNYYSEGPTDFYYEGNLTIDTEEKLLMTKLSLNTSIAYENNILESQKSIDLNTIEYTITGRSPEFSEPKIEVKNLNRSTGEVAVGDEFEVTITGKNIQEYAVYDGEFDITAMNNRKDDYSERYYENTTYVDNSMEYLSPEGVFKIDDDAPGLTIEDNISNYDYTRSKLPEYENIKYLGMEIFGIRYKVKVTEMALGKQISFRGRFGQTQLLTTDNITLDVNYAGKLGFKETPKTLSFNDSFISVFTSTIERSDENWGIEIEDSRQQKNPWWLTVKQVSPFKSVDNDLLPQVLIFRQAGQDDQWLSADTAISVHYEDGLSADDYTTSWSKNEGFFLKVPPGTAKAKPYQTELQWYIQDTPI